MLPTVHMTDGIANVALKASGSIIRKKAVFSPNFTKKECDMILVLDNPPKQLSRIGFSTIPSRKSTL